MAHVPRVFVHGHAGPGSLLIEGEQAKRLSAVMRLREGDRFLVFNGDGREWDATVSESSKRGLLATVGACIRQEPAPPLTVEVWIGLVRPNRFDWALEKLVEAGADVIRPLLTEHAARGEGSSAARQERWERIVIEGAEQCGRLHLAVVGPPARLDDLLARHRGALIVADHSGRPWPQLVPLMPMDGILAVAVGPEGGFSSDEMERAEAQGALVARLGPNILRTETAAIVAVSLIRAM